jgi:hypothetical protein
MDRNKPIFDRRRFQQAMDQLSRRQLPINKALAPQLPSRTALPVPDTRVYVSDSVGAQSLLVGQAQLNAVAVMIVPARRRCGVRLTNLSGVELFWGPDKTVTSANGDMIVGQRGFSLYVETQSAIWCCTASGTGQLSFAELSD